MIITIVAMSVGLAIGLLLSIVIFGSALLILVPYDIWLDIQNSKGKYLELSNSDSFKQDFVNAFSWWKSLITHKPAC